MISVWILIVLMTGDPRGNNSNGVTVVDNISDKQNCERVAEHFQDMTRGYYSKPVTKCVQVWKVKP